MKKIILSVFALMAFSISASAMRQYIVTDCGTKHRIPDKSSAEDACFFLDYFTAEDCK